jgi:hypothetical protein
MRHVKFKKDVCIIGGGMAGVCAAVAAARHGSEVVLIHDRPVLGGNASSEVRMWICGAQGLDCAPNENLLETGIIEEIRLKNMFRNPGGNWSIWDSVVYETARQEPNIELMVNCTCLDAVVESGKIRSVKAWQMTTETWVTVEADIFIDCSGDSILIPLTGAEHRIGRESSAEFGEDIQPDVADRKTMGMSCLLQTRETNRARNFIPPDWANVYVTDADLNNRPHDLHSHNFWWLELGGDKDSIHDAEEIKDDLLKSAFGIWDHIKNRDNHGADNWQLEWVGFLPGKRESRRYIGDHVMTQNDIRAEGRFDDLIAYGGWPMDDHHPAGMKFKGDPTKFHAAPAPYGIPYRCLYSRNIDNLMFAGRNISVTHAALSSTRVMATCSVIGQAVGTAATIAVRNSLTPREVGQQRIKELQQQLMEDDCYLPWKTRQVSALTQEALIEASGTGADSLRNGIGRVVDSHPNSWRASVGDQVIYRWGSKKAVSSFRLVLDSNLSRGAFGKSLATNMPCRYTLDMKEQTPPSSLVKAFHIDALDRDGVWKTVCRIEENTQRLIRKELNEYALAIRLTIDATWGDKTVNIFDWDVS